MKFLQIVINDRETQWHAEEGAEGATAPG